MEPNTEFFGPRKKLVDFLVPELKDLGFVQGAFLSNKDPLMWVVVLEDPYDTIAQDRLGNVVMRVKKSA